MVQVRAGDLPHVVAPVHDPDDQIGVVEVVLVLLVETADFLERARRKAMFVPIRCGKVRLYGKTRSGLAALGDATGSASRLKSANVLW